MLKKSKKIFILCLLLCISMLFCKICCTSVIAKENNEDGSPNVNIDTEKIGSVNVEIRPKEYRPEDIEFRMYKIGNISEDCKISLTSDFEKYPISLDNSNDEEWKELANTLSSYIYTDDINAKYIAPTNGLGYACFDEVEVGVYLVMGDEYYTDKYIYKPVPFILCVPYVENDGTCFYNIRSVAKYEKIVIEEPEIFMSKRVIILWDDLDYESRPKSLKVCLVKDNEIVDTVVLSQENNWRYTWDNLSTKYSWNIVENIDENSKDEFYIRYSSISETEGSTIVITKKYRENKPEEPKVPEKPTEPEKLPATGVLWWPVPILIVIGTVFVVCGLIKCKGEKNE